MPVGRLKNKTALITGSSSGLGRAIAIRYAYEGANICCVDLYPTPRNMISPSTGKEDRLENRAATGATHETLDDMFSYDEDGNDRFIFVKADMSVPAEAENAVAQCVQFFGRLDIMVNNAGIIVESQHERPLMCHETSEEDYDLTMRVNAKGVFLGCKYACKQMLNQEVWPRLRDDGMEDGSQTEGDRGWIINTASVSAMVASEGAPSYCASKGAVVMLTRQVALDYAKWRIHCNALCPGFLHTTMTQNLRANPDVLATINAAHPFGGMGNVEDVARAAVFLASEDVRWVTGVALPVDGGYTVQ